MSIQARHRQLHQTMKGREFQLCRTANKVRQTIVNFITACAVDVSVSVFSSLSSDHYLHVLGSDPLGLVNEGRLLTLSQDLPLGAKSL